MTPKERYDLRTEIYSKIPKDKIYNFSHAIQSSALQLYGIVSDDRYIDANRILCVLKLPSLISGIILL